MTVHDSLTKGSCATRPRMYRKPIKLGWSRKLTCPFISIQDAVYFSPHKLVGGPGAPGILVVKRRLLNIAKVPTQPGGGTVFFVTNRYGRVVCLLPYNGEEGLMRGDWALSEILISRRSHTYLKNAEEREESGTPDILGSLRAGLAIQVKGRLGAKLIQAAEDAVVSRVMSALSVCIETESAARLRDPVSYGCKNK